HILEHTGMRVDSDEGRRILMDAGARVDEATRIVRFPPELVEQALAAAPRRFALGGRRKGWGLPMNAGESSLCLDGGPTLVLDRQTGERRPSTHTDWLEATQLCDALEEIGMWWSPVEGKVLGDTPAEWVSSMTETLRNFSRHVQDSFEDAALAPWTLEVLEIVFGGRREIRRLHPYSFLICPVSPLVLERWEIDAWLALRGYDIPVAAMPMPIMGATAPGSLLATVLLGNCETLGTLCLVETAEPGVPFIHAPTLATMDPRSGRVAGNAPHAALNAAGVEMARFYGLPAMGSGPGCDAYAPGIQAAYEKAIGTAFGCLAWPDILVGPGTLAEATVSSFEQTLIDVEVWRLCRKTHEGVTVQEDRWLSEVLERVGPGGQFLGETSTRSNVREGEWLLPQLGVHDSYDAWAAAGAPDIMAEARVQVEDILARHEPTALGEDVEGALEELRLRALRATV
ncbi:MAG: trimethylamine methyltransferase family protein, partial [Thermoleophilia bacterium]|nr:trimethylamine methyltransferase family protein [Thermoleophilia bacterium]